MAGYMLYFPGARSITLEPLDRCGLTDLARDLKPSCAPVSRGPDNKPGTLMAWLNGSGDDPVLGIFDSQRWQPCKPNSAAKVAAGDFWIGFDTQRPLRPAEIERKKTFVGYWIPLGDGQRWYVPAATGLPRLYGLDDNGEFAATPLPEFRPFVQAADSITARLAHAAVDAAEGKAKADLTVREAFDFAVDALALNYRLNAELVTVLNLLSEGALLDVVKAAIDLPAILKRPPGGDGRPKISVTVEV